MHGARLRIVLQRLELPDYSDVPGAHRRNRSGVPDRHQALRVRARHGSAHLAPGAAVPRPAGVRGGERVRGGDPGAARPPVEPHIFYTGSARVGRLVAAAAARHTTPVSLELGGKSPVIVSPDYDDLELAAKRVLYGKVQNVGQVRALFARGRRMRLTVTLLLANWQLCVSPDYVLVPRSISNAFQAALKKVYATLFPVDPLHEDSNWGRIVNKPNFGRVKNLIAQTRGEIIVGGGSDPATLRVALTIVAGVALDDLLMEE